MGLRLFFLTNFPGATFIQGATFIPDSIEYLCFSPLLISGTVSNFHLSLVRKLKLDSQAHKS